MMTKCNCGSGLETDYQDRHGCAACRRVSTQAIIDAAKYACVRDGLRVRLAGEGDRVVVSEVFARVSSRGQDIDWQWVPATNATVPVFVEPVIMEASGIKPPLTDRLPPPGPSTFVIDREATGNMAVAYSRNTLDNEIPRVCSYEHGPAVDNVRQHRWGVGTTGEEPDDRITSDPQWHYWPDGGEFPWRPLGQPTIDQLCQTAMWLRWLEVQRGVFEAGVTAFNDSQMLCSAVARGWETPEIRYLNCAAEHGGRIVVVVEAEKDKIPTRSGIRLRFREEMTVERDTTGRVRVIDDYAVHIAQGLVSYRPG